MTNPSTQPKKTSDNTWYKNYMLMIFVIGLPALVVVACIFFIFYAVRHQDNTVQDDWYMDGKALYQDASQDQLAYDLGVAGLVRFSDTSLVFELNYPQTTTRTGKFSDGTPLYYPKTLTLDISHATDKNFDQNITLTHTHDNIYTATITPIHLTAKYYLKINNQQTHKWRLITAQRLPTSTVALTPLPAFAPQ